MSEARGPVRQACYRYVRPMSAIFYFLIVSHVQAGECFPRLQRFIAEGLAVDASTIKPSSRLLDLICAADIADHISVSAKSCSSDLSPFDDRDPLGPASDAMEITQAIESEFGVVIPKDKYTDIKTISDYERYICPSEEQSR
jgi:hypothetical protein